MATGGEVGQVHVRRAGHVPLENPLLLRDRVASGVPSQFRERRRQTVVALDPPITLPALDRMVTSRRHVLVAVYARGIGGENRGACAELHIVPTMHGGEGGPQSFTGGDG